MERHHLRATVFLIGTVLLCSIAGWEFLQMHHQDKILPGSGVTGTRTLSSYSSTLAGTQSDVLMYELNSGKPGATILVLGGTHPNEAAGFMAAVLLIEHVVMKEGRLLVIPQVCGNGFTCTDPLEASPQSFALQSKSGERQFRFGSRGSNPIESWPDPIVYLHHPSGQQLSGNEIRNLNRSYPGRVDGTITEQIAYAVMQLIKQEKVDLAFDLHEAAPEIPIINAIVTHEKGKEIGASALLNLEFENLQYALEMSPPNFHGLSHREWGDWSTTYPFLMETSNPIQGRLRGPTSAALILEGLDKRYQEAAKLVTVRITYDEKGEPLARRVGRHLRGLQAIFIAFQEAFPDKRITVNGIPSYEEIVQRGVGDYLQ
ncbi:MAG: succinylglutamate desuccinylase [bacterium]